MAAVPKAQPAGSQTVKQVPWPGVLTTVILPP
jgi:hypothetical protein